MRKALSSCGMERYRLVAPRFVKGFPPWFSFFSVIDAIDNKILSLLGKDGRASFSSMGEVVGLSPHAVADRVRRMQRDGVITGFSVTIDLGRVGRSLDALIDVSLLPTTDPVAFEKRVAALPAVRELVFVTGRFDYELRVACLDADDLDQTVRAIRSKAGAAATETRIVMRSASLGRPFDPRRASARS